MIFHSSIKNTTHLIFAIISIISGFLIALIGGLLFFPTLFLFPTISDIANFATFIATIVLIFTVLEMREQRKTTYKPTIVLNNSNALFYEFIFDPERKSILHFELVDRDVFIDDEKEVESSQFRIKAYNIGLGSASNVKIFFKYDHIKFVEQFTRINTLKDVEITNSDDNVHLTFGTIGTKFPIDAYNYQSFDFLLPVNIDKDHLLIKIPAPFQILYSALIFSKFYSDKKNLSIIEIPDIHMMITYNDIEGNNYSQKYLLKFKHGSIQSNFSNTYTNASGYLEITLE